MNVYNWSFYVLLLCFVNAEASANSPSIYIRTECIKCESMVI